MLAWYRKLNWHVTIVMASLFMIAGTATAQTITTPQQFSDNGHWYQFISPVDNWDAAKQWAEVRGGYLATATSVAENSFLVSILDQVHSAAYLGGYEPNNDEVWMWVTGESWAWTNWYAGQPSNTGGDENYLSLTESAGWGSGQWNDAASVPGNAALIEYDSDPNQPSSNAAFCDNIDDGVSLWTVSQGSQALVSSPTHSGTMNDRSLEFHGYCHSSVYRNNFEASTGYYSVWVNQQHHQAGFGIYIQVQPGANPDQHYRESYFFSLQATDGQQPANMSLWRQHANGQSDNLAQQPTTFLKGEWIQVFVRRGTDNTIVSGYVRNGVRDSVIGVDPDPIESPGQFYLWACSDVPPYTYFDDVCFEPTLEPFCDDFDNPDPNAWQERWVTSVQGAQIPVSTPTHSGTNAIEFHGSCHSSMYRSDFSAMSGYYTAWVNQQHHQAGFGIYIQVQPGVNPDQHYRESYFFSLQAADGQQPANMSLWRQHANGQSDSLAQQPTTFLKGEWIQVFIRKGTDNTIVGGYVRNGVRDSVIGVDPDPIESPGQFYLWACSDVAPYTYFDDAGYDPDPNGRGCDMDVNHDNPEFRDVRCFNGVNGYVQVSDNSSLNIAEGLSIEAWINMAELPAVSDLEYAIVSKWAGTGSAGGRYLFGVSSSGKLCLDLEDASVYSTKLLQSNKWHHVAASFDGSHITFYIDGQWDSQTEVSSGFGNSTTPLAIGKNVHNNFDPAVQPYYFKGEMDEVRISNRVRSPYEFSLNSPCTSDANTVALWHLDETSSTTVVDASTYNNSGIANGSGCGNCWCLNRVGDANQSLDDEPTLGDISVLIDAKFISGTCDGILHCLNEADINQSGGTNPICDDVTIGDISILIDYLFITGESLGLRNCDDWNAVTPVALKESPDIRVASQSDGVTTTVSVTTPVALRALQLELEGAEGARPNCLLDNRLNLFYGQTSNQVRIGIIDVDGGQTIAAGVTEVVRIPGEYEIVSAVVVDNQLRESVALIGGDLSSVPLPTTFALAQNYPNPFNPVTEIKFALPVAADVRLEVFNVLGQTVATLVEQRLEAGQHSMTWDASGQASGVYMYRLTAGEFSETRKMLLLK